MSIVYRRGSETIESVLDDARNKTWHAGNQRAYYEYYKAKVLRLSKDNRERDEALKKLRLIFRLGV